MGLDGQSLQHYGADNKAIKPLFMIGEVALSFFATSDNLKKLGNPGPLAASSLLNVGPE